MKSSLVKQFPSDEKIPNKVLNIKFGIDPTSDKLHLGHLIPLKIVKQFKDGGNNIDIVLGTFTAQLGDPSGKDTMRPILDFETTQKNADSIIKQVKRILGDDINIHFNHVWFEKMNSIEMINILSKFNVNHLLSRDSFQKRISLDNPIGLHELIVPTLQGIDSVQLKTDIEIGGSDQLFNFNITRDIQRNFNQIPEICLMTGIINGIDGRKMSKSFNNCIFINDNHLDIFGKTMSISDEVMFEWFPFFIDEEVDINKPMESKKKLAFQITKEIWNEDLASEALKHFESVIQNKNIPSDIPLIESKNLIEIIKTTLNCSSSQARRLIEQKAIKINDNVIDDTVKLESNDIIRIGKRNYVKIK